MQLIPDTMDFTAYTAEPEARQRVRAASEYTDAVLARLTSPDELHGLSLPWSKTRHQFRVRPNELTLWPGINGHGKSLVLNQVMLGLMAQGEKALIASMEMPPPKTMERMARQACKSGQPGVDDIREFSAWTDRRLWIYDHLGSVQWKKLLAVMRYCAAELGMTQFVVDSLMRCGIGEQDYDGQKEFLDALCTFRMDYPVHVHLVMHSRKGENEYTPPGKFDAKGTGTMTDLADNVVTVWRNKRKEAVIQQSSYQRRPADKDVIDQPDALLIVDKQRHGEWEGKIGLWYLPGAMQFVQDAAAKPIELMEFGA